MSEQQLEDPNSRINIHFKIIDLECDCGHEQEVEVQEEYSHSTTTWYAEWKCSQCGQDRENEGWYSDDDL